MKKSLLAAAAAAGAMRICGGASAAVYDWTLTGKYGGSGTLTTGAADGGGYDVTAFAGFAAGEAITGLLGGDPGPAGATSPSRLFFFDNILFPDDKAALVDPNGLLFSTDAHPEASIWSNGGGDYNYTSEVGGAYTQDALTGEVFAAVPVPEPAATGVLGAALVALSWARRFTRWRTSGQKLARDPELSRVQK